MAALEFSKVFVSDGDSWCIPDIPAKMVYHGESLVRGKPRHVFTVVRGVGAQECSRTLALIPYQTFEVGDAAFKFMPGSEGVFLERKIF